MISLQAVRELKNSQEEDPAYRAKILSMNKVELLEEMVHFQQERARKGRLTAEMMIRGKVLFRALELSAESEELRQFSRIYRKHLDYEFADYLKRNPC